MSKKDKKKAKKNKSTKKTNKVKANAVLSNKTKSVSKECGHEATVVCGADAPTGHENQTFRCMRMASHKGEHFIGMEVVAINGKAVE